MLKIAGHNEWALPGQGTICAGTLNQFDWTPYLEPPPPPPSGVRIKSIERIGGTQPRFVIAFEGSGMVEIKEGVPWYADIGSESGAMVSEIKAP